MNAKRDSQAPTEDLAALRERAAQADEYLDLARRAKADFLNYQDRVLREKGEWKREAVREFVSDFLPALDSFSLGASVRGSGEGSRSGDEDPDRRILSPSPDLREPALTAGLKVVEREFLRVLAKHGIVPVEAVGEDFDPSRHEAVGAEERDDVPPGKVVEQVRRGWRIGDQVLRPASVRISKARES